MEGHFEVAMDRHVFLALASLILAGGCDKKLDQTADNTKANEQDRGPTPGSQSNSKADLETTQAIRRALMADDTLSFDAKNVKVITADGVITLRGPVKNEAERAAIEDIARRNAAGNRVNSHLEAGAPETQRR
jgi:hyperosmotically inducible periplasmic protein